MTTPDPRLFSTPLRQTAPFDSRWPKQHIEPYRNQLLGQLQDVERALDEVEQQHEETAEAAVKERAELLEKIPDVGDNPSEVEWLTRRAAQADHGLAACRSEVASLELWVQRQKLTFEAHELGARIAQVDDLLEPAEYAAGNAAQMAIIMLDLQEAGADHAHDTGVLEIARQRLVHAKRMHREIHNALRRLQKAAERSQKK